MVTSPVSPPESPRAILGGSRRRTEPSPLLEVTLRIVTLSARRTGVTLADIGPMRAARRQALLDLDLRDRRSGWPLEMVVKAAAAGWSIADTPIPYAERQGRSKVTGTVRGTIQTIGDMGAILRAAE